MTRQPVKKKKKILVWCTAGTLLFICLTSLAGVYLLKSGIAVERFNIGPVTVSDSTLVWNDRLELQVGTLTVKEDHEPSTAIISRERASRAVRAVDYILRLFSKINIRSVKIGQHDLFFDLLRKNADSFLLNLATETTKLTVSLEVDQHKLRAEIRSFSDSRIDLELYGAVQLDAAEAIASGTLNVDIEKSFPVRLSFSSDGNTVSFRGAEAGIISDIKPFVDLFELEDNVQKWITDYLAAERYRLLSFSGEYVFGEPMSLFHSLEAEIMVDDASYIFEPDLEPIYDDHPRAFFNNGILDIRPNNPIFYGHDGGSSRLDIDFNDPENFMLNVYINAETMADEAILDLLRYYSIDLPLVQVDGTTRADLRLSINLQTEDVSGEGLFFIDDGIIIYDGAEFSLTDSRFSLKDSEVHLEHLELSYDDIFVATVSGWIFADRDVWDLDIDLDKLEFNLGESTIRLDNSVLKPEIKYRVSVDGHFLEAGESSWMLDSTAVRLGPFR
ncbi:MAG: DUF3971 domain-containing protein, partial [Desulfocapsaceae bacterium]|nr:DUF3971 domain-containing protein [Desulfocapsaceae bacterium]